MKNNKNFKKDKPVYQTVEDADISSFDIINKYGTYEIQPTADTENQYPTIAQGFNKKQINTDCDNPQSRKK